MSVNGITGASEAYSSYTAAPKSTETKQENVQQPKTENETGVVYEPSKESKTASSKKTYKTDTNLVAKLKADADARNAQFKSLVEQMLTKQGKTFNNANDIWKVLASGDFTVDPATKAQAQADIAEDGYWGVNQTSDRILDFAKALSGNDKSKAQELADAFKKGFDQATKAWGGKLPDISQQTYDKVLEKFDSWMNGEDD